MPTSALRARWLPKLDPFELLHHLKDQKSPAALLVYRIVTPKDCFCLLMPSNGLHPKSHLERSLLMCKVCLWLKVMRRSDFLLHLIPHFLFLKSYSTGSRKKNSIHGGMVEDDCSMSLVNIIYTYIQPQSCHFCILLNTMIVLCSILWKDILKMALWHVMICQSIQSACDANHPLIGPGRAHTGSATGMTRALGDTFKAT